MEKPRWTKERVLETIIEEHKKGADLRIRSIKDNNNLLWNAYHATIYNEFFTSWKTAVAAAGITLGKKRRWDKEKVKQKLLERKEKGKPLNYFAVYNEELGLSKAIRKHFGSHDEALKYCNINPKKVRKWSEHSKSEILKNIIIWYVKGMDLSASAVRKRKYSRKIYQSAVRESKFGSWENAVKSAGIDYERYRKMQRWSAKSVKEEILRRYENGEPLNAGSVPSALHQSGSRRFRSWGKAIAACGLDYKEIKLRTSMNLEEIVSEVKKLNAEGRDLSARAVAENKDIKIRRIYHHGKNKFGWEHVITQAGLDYDDIRKNTKPYTIEELKCIFHELEKDGRSLRAVDIMSNPEYRKYYSAASKRFESWESFLSAIGIDSSKYCNYTDWKEGKEVLNELKRLFSSGIVSGVRTKSQKLSTAIQKYYGSVEQAAKQAGLVCCESGKITKKIVDSNPDFYKIIHECNKDFIMNLAKRVYFWSGKKRMRTMPIEELNSEATVIFFDLVTKKPPKQDLRDFAYKPIFNALVKYNRSHFKESYFGDEKLLDWLDNKNNSETDTETDTFEIEDFEF